MQIIPMRNLKIPLKLKNVVPKQMARCLLPKTAMAVSLSWTSIILRELFSSSTKPKKLTKA